MWYSLNGEWELDRSPADLSEPPFDASKPLPEKILVPFPPESKASGVGGSSKAGFVWYRRNFTVPAAWPVRAGFLQSGTILLMRLDLLKC